MTASAINILQELSFVTLTFRIRVDVASHTSSTIARSQA